MTKGVVLNKNYFVGIGAQKSGTSWLAAYLLHHPQVAMSSHKEMDYFNSVLSPVVMTHKRHQAMKYYHKAFEQLEKELREGMSLPQMQTLRSLEFYIQVLKLYTNEAVNNTDIYKHFFLNTAIRNQHTIYGEISPDYSLMNASGYRLIYDYNPKAKIIILLRNPIERYWSSLRHYEKNTFNKNFANESFAKMLPGSHYYELTNYKRIISEVYKVFPKEQVGIFFYEELFSKNSNTLRSITKFLEIDFIAADTSKIIHEGIDIEFPSHLRLSAITAMLPIYKYIEELFDGMIPDLWKKDINLLEKKVLL